MPFDDQLAAVAHQMQQRWFDPSTARQSQPENGLDAASQKFELRVKLLEDRIDHLEKVLRKAGLKI